MCKISIASSFSEKQVDKYSEGASEKGAGFFIVRKNGDRIMFKDEDGKKAKEIFKNVKDTSMVLFHSRIPSAGTVSYMNTQPFYAKDEFVLAHNGTISIADMIPMLMALKMDDLDIRWSDSRLLFEIFRNTSEQIRLFVLSHVHGNFVYIDLKKGKIHLFGNWYRDKQNIVHTSYIAGKSDYYCLDISLDNITDVEEEKDYTRDYYGYGYNHYKRRKWDVIKKEWVEEDEDLSGGPGSGYMGC